MKTPSIYIVILVLLIGCKNEDKLTLAPQIFSGENCEGCPQISINIPQVLEETRLAENINSSISNEITSILLFEDTDNSQSYTIEEGIEAFKKEHREITKLYQDEVETWEATIEGDVSYEDKNMLTIILASYLYSGGAHGYESIRFLNFEKKTGKKLKNYELFKDEEAFKNLAEKAFRKAEGIAENKSINATGFMFEGETFYLPENLGFTKEGIKLLYNQYEVASYADGPIEIIIPYESAKSHLKGALKKALATTTFED
ncbi:DUF3298 domain-containing protein [Aurantibacter sp.]|uniref:DUF3298 and DUF4163 domain-containing protein n=1 Tax=Aurantibacter sp. TaxID=2807103 RepID=UPI003262E9B0